MADNMNVVPEAVSRSDDVELTIRQAYQTETDLKFTCPASWTIKQVKERVKDSLPNHPDVLTQRIIYSGAHLNNEQVVGDILRERNHVSGDQVFFHLMIAQPYQQTTPVAEVRRRNVNAAPQPTVTSPLMPELPSYEQNMVAWQQYWAAYSQLPPDAQASEHQRLTAYYYTYAMMNHNVPGGAPAPVTSHDQNAAVWRARVHGGPAPGAAGAPPVVAAAPAPRNRVDILEVAYRIFKLVLLFSAILLYSSFERFAAVLCAALFIYFIQLRRNHARNRAQAAAAAAPPANQEQPHVNNNNNGENDGENATPAAEGGENAAPASDTPAPAAVQPTGMQVFVATCYSFVTSFFASLVPDHPMPMDLN